MKDGGKLNMIEYCENRRDENKMVTGKKTTLIIITVIVTDVCFKQ